MNFIVASHDGARILCQFADMTPVQWLDARVAEAIGYSYAIRFETRRGAERCAFIHNGAIVALGDWDHDTEENRSRDGRCTCGMRTAQITPGVVARLGKVGRNAPRRGPARGVQIDRGRGADVGTSRALRVVAQLPPLASAPIREYRRDIISTGWPEYETVTRITQGLG